MFLSKTLYPLLSTDLNQEDTSRHDRKNVDLDVKHVVSTQKNHLNEMNLLITQKKCLN